MPHSAPKPLRPASTQPFRSDAITSVPPPLIDARRRRLVAALPAALLAAIVPLLPSAPALAQLRIDVSGVGASQIPIAIMSFGAEGQVPADVAEVVRADLARSGLFRVVDIGGTLTETGTPDYAALAARQADNVVGGSVSRLADGRFDVRFRLTDAVRQSAVGGLSMTVSQPDLRLAGHRIADWIFEKLTGERGVFSTRIAFVTKQAGRYRLNIADWDGEGAVTALTSPEPIISPSWSPDGTRLAYVSFQNRKPVVYVHTLATGRQQAVADFKGSNSAPAWSPDGRTLAVTLSREGDSQIFLIDAAGGNARRLTRSSAIDTEPAFSPDGKTLYFTSDRGGSPQIYRMPATGGDVQRVTFGGAYNVSPRVSPDGRQLAFVTRRGGRFSIAVKDLASGNESVLTDTGVDESPSYSPNGRWILYTVSGSGRDALMAVTVDGRVKQRLSSPAGDVREAAWGPFAQ